MNNKRTLNGVRILVTGGTGFIGTHLVKRLIQEGAIVGVLAFGECKFKFNINEDAYTFFNCDLRDVKSTIDTIASFSPRIIYHLAAHPDGREDFKQAGSSIQSIISGTLNTLEGFRLCGGELFIYGDSSKVYGDCNVPYRETMPEKPLSSYAIAKTAGWQFCELYSKLYGFNIVSVRPTMIYGPGQGFNLFSFVFNCMQEGKKEIRLLGGDQTRDPLFIDDAIEVFITIGRLGKCVSGHIINIGGGQEETVLDLADRFLKISGSDIPVVSCPELKRPTDMHRSFCDNDDAYKLLGWRPTTDKSTGFAKTYQFMLKSARHLQVIQKL